MYRFTLREVPNVQIFYFCLRDPRDPPPPTCAMWDHPVGARVFGTGVHVGTMPVHMTLLGAHAASVQPYPESKLSTRLICLLWEMAWYTPTEGLEIVEFNAF